MPSATEVSQLTAKGREVRSAFADRLTAELGRIVVGQQGVVERVLIGLLTRGHLLIEGVPGIAKTLLAKSVAESVRADFSRVQFTPDLLPADLIGTLIYDQRNQTFVPRKGPVFTNFLLADEINRAPAKVQSALLEAMQERQVTVGRRTIRLDEPYSVMATQNPVEQEGTYPLPEAQLDRFLFKQIVSYPREEEYAPILERTTGEQDVVIEPVADAETIVRLRAVARAVAVPEVAQRYAVQLVMGTQPDSDYAPDSIGAYVALGSSPRGAQGLILGGKVRALLAGRFSVSTDDIRSVALPVLRHRVLVNFHAQANRVTPDLLVDDVLQSVEPPHTAS